MNILLIILLSWNVVSDAKGYIVYSGTSSGKYTKSYITTEPQINVDVKKNTKRYYVVSSFNDIGISEHSEEVVISRNKDNTLSICKRIKKKTI